jgi:hypothetical protein
LFKRRPQLGQPLARLGRRAPGHADAAVGTVDPVDAQLLEGRHVGQQRVALVHGHRQGAHLALVVDGERGVAHGAVDVRAQHGHGHVAGALEGHVVGLHAEHVVHAFVRRVVGRVLARPAQVQRAGLVLGGLDEVGPALDGALLGHHQCVGRVVEPEHRRHVLGLVLDLAFHRLQHHVRQVDADDVHAVGRQLVGGAPQQRTTGAGLVLDDGVDGRALLLQHHLLVPRREVASPPGGKACQYMTFLSGQGCARASGAVTASASAAR